MKSSEFTGFVCDYCKKPFTIEQAESRALHLEGTLTINNTSGMVDKDFCTKTCLLKALEDLQFGDWS